MSGVVIHMSRIGKKPISFSPDTTVTVNDRLVRIKGPKGELEHTVHPLAEVRIEENRINVTRKNDSKLAKSLHGLTRSLLANMLTGVKSGYQKRLELVGTGYRAVKKGQGLTMTLGFSHPVEVQPPAGIALEVDGNTAIIVEGIDKQLVGQVAANIRALKPPEPYKGKGVRYSGEHVRRKAGKQAKAGGTA